MGGKHGADGQLTEPNALGPAFTTPLAGLLLLPLRAGFPLPARLTLVTLTANPQRSALSDCYKPTAQAAKSTHSPTLKQAVCLGE